MAREIVIDGALKEKWPDTRLGCFLYTTNVEKKNEELWKYLKQTTFKIVRDRLFDMSVNEFPNIRESRSAYKAFGKDPSRYRVSSEALIRRVGQGKGLYQVNTVVDANNLISIESGFSVGSYDTEKLEGNLILRIGMPNETYKGIGKEELNIEGLPLICDERGPVGSSTSDSERAMITEGFRTILTMIYSFSPNKDLEQAMEYGKEYLEKYAGAKDIRTWIVK